jgi:hypothetical protein
MGERTSANCPIILPPETIRRIKDVPRTRVLFTRNISFKTLVLNEEGRMSTHLLLPGTENVGPGIAIAGLNSMVAMALVIVGLLLALSVSSVAWFCDRPKTIHPPIRIRAKG